MKARKSADRSSFFNSQLSQGPKYSEQDQKERMEEWLELAIKAAHVGAWVWDLNAGNKEIIRTAMYDKIMGIDSNMTWTRDDWLKRIHPIDRDATFRSMNEVTSGMQSEYNAEYRIIVPDGSIRWVNSWGTNIRDSEGKPVRVTGILKDITLQKQLEQERDQYVAILSHDLRNPLAAARTNAEVIRRFPNQIEQEGQMLDRIVANIERADRMIQDLLDSSRMQSGVGINLKMERCNLKEITTEFVKELAYIHGDRASLRVSGKASSTFEGSWSKDGIRRILENLVGNAIKYGAENRPVNVELDAHGGEVTLSVHNFGNTIPIEEQKTLFEPFRRAKVVEQGSTRGWGLGLALVRGVAEAHGGRVEVQSNTEAGTTFAVKFPLSGAGSLH